MSLEQSPSSQGRLTLQEFKKLPTDQIAEMIKTFMTDKNWVIQLTVNEVLNNPTQLQELYDRYDGYLNTVEESYDIMMKMHQIYADYPDSRPII